MPSNPENILEQWYGAEAVRQALSGEGQAAQTTQTRSNPDQIRCGHCGRMFNRSDRVPIPGYTSTNFCPRCREQYFFHCDDCNRWVQRGATINVTINGTAKRMCQECAYRSNLIFRCYRCGNWHERIHGTADRYNNMYCRECVRDSFLCEECGCYHRNSNKRTIDGRTVCGQCYSNILRKTLRDHYYVPDPLIFHGASRNSRSAIFFGLEIETVRKSGDSQNLDYMRKIVESINNTTDGELAYLKTDSSVTYNCDYGFEMVTHPATYEYLAGSESFKKTITLLNKLDYISHDARTCGLHIHFSRKTFGHNDTERAENVAKLLFLFERHWDNLKKFSRRNEGEINQWARSYAREYGLRVQNNKESAKRISDIAKSTSNRYFCVNLQNQNTIEIRIFRGTLNYKTILASIQLVKRLTDTCMAKTLDEIIEMTWEDIFADAPTELHDYLVSKQLLADNLTDEERQAREHEHQTRECVAQAIAELGRMTGQTLSRQSQARVVAEILNNTESAGVQTHDGYRPVISQQELFQILHRIVNNPGANDAVREVVSDYMNGERAVSQ